MSRASRAAGGRARGKSPGRRSALRDVRVLEVRLDIEIDEAPLRIGGEKVAIEHLGDAEIIVNRAAGIFDLERLRPVVIAHGDDAAGVDALSLHSQLPDFSLARNAGVVSQVFPRFVTTGKSPNG